MEFLGLLRRPSFDDTPWWTWGAAGFLTVLAVVGFGSGQGAERDLEKFAAAPNQAIATVIEVTESGGGRHATYYAPTVEFVTTSGVSRREVLEDVTVAERYEVGDRIYVSFDGSESGAVYDQGNPPDPAIGWMVGWVCSLLGALALCGAGVATWISVISPRRKKKIKTLEKARKRQRAAELRASRPGKQ